MRDKKKEKNNRKFNNICKHLASFIVVIIIAMHKEYKIKKNQQ